MFASIQLNTCILYIPVNTLYTPVPRKFKTHEIIKSYIVLWRRDPCALDSRKEKVQKRNGEKFETLFT
jgi:hypothetical protein